MFVPRDLENRVYKATQGPVQGASTNLNTAYPQFLNNTNVYGNLQTLFRGPNRSIMRLPAQRPHTLNHTLTQIVNPSLYAEDCGDGRRFQDCGQVAGPYLDSVQVE